MSNLQIILNKYFRNSVKGMSCVLASLSLCSCTQIEEIYSNATGRNGVLVDSEVIRHTDSAEKTVLKRSTPESKTVLAAATVDDVSAILPADYEPTPIPTVSASWTLAELQQMAENCHPTIQQSIGFLNTAYGVQRQVGLKPNPVFGYVGDEMGDEGTSGRQGVFLSQTIVTGDKLKWNRYVVQQEINGLQWQLETARARVRNDVQLKYLEVLANEQKLKMTTELEKITKKGVETAEALFNAQQTAKPDILQAEIQHNAVRILKQNAQYDYETAWKELATLIGNSSLSPMPLNGQFSKPTTERNFEQSYEQLIASSPLLQTAYAKRQRANAQISRQKAQLTPNILTQLALTKDNVTKDQLTSVQIGIPLLIFNRNQ